MKKIFLPLALALFLLVVVFAAFAAFRQDRATAAPEVFQSGISGGCYIAAPDSCKIHVDPFMVNVDDQNNENLVEFQLRANGSTIYQFKTDALSEYRPTGDYTPTLVTQDFAASCGTGYEVQLLARDEGDGNVLYLLGTTGVFTCPTNIP